VTKQHDKQIAALQHKLSALTAKYVEECRSHDATALRLRNALALLALVEFRAAGLSARHCAIQIIEEATDQADADQQAAAWRAQDGVRLVRILRPTWRDGWRVQALIDADPVPASIAHPYGIVADAALPENWRYVILPPSLREAGE
jgi:predicted HAD superfamily Cof-like phosphohydrolase